ncbi:MAG: hypothetical protein ABI743_07895, partial [bacterium]
MATVHVGPSAVTRQLLSIALTPSSRQIIDQGAGSAITCTAIGTFDMPPIVQDITGTVTWTSTATDVATFASNVCTGVGMGTTSITATQSAVTSPGTKIIVKPLEFLPYAWPVGSYVGGVDANQSTGDFWIVKTYPSPPTILMRYSDAGTFLSSFPCNTIDPKDLTIQESTGYIYGYNSYIPGYMNTRVFTSTGTELYAYRIDNGNGPN